MSEPEIVEAKKGRVKKNGDPDRRSTSSALNVSKARSKVKDFLKAGKQIIDNSDSESSDIIKTVLKAKPTKAKTNFIQLSIWL